MASTKQQRKGKSMTKEQRQEKAAREKCLLSAKEKMLGIKRDVLKIVESMLEENTSMQWFFKNCPKLCQQDYEDVIQERSIEHLCGYPLCNKPLVQVLKQQYRISRVSNKVYDLTERKSFCCNECYKASNYLKAQLSEVPLHLRQAGMSIPIHLISEKENSGSAGEEIVFQVSIDKDEIEKPCAENPSTNLSNILDEEVKGFEEHLSKLKITEHTYEKPFVFGSETQNEIVKNNPNTKESGSESSEPEDDPEDDDEPENFPEHSNISALSNKHMPIPEQSNKAVLIQPIRAASVSELPTVKPSIDFISNVFYDWFTEDTMKYLLGERKMYAMKADLLFQTMVHSDSPNSEELSSVKNEYIDLCLKMDQLQEEEEFSDSVEFEIDASSSVSEDKTGRSVIVGSTAASMSQQNSNSIPKRRPKGKSKEKKAVSFAPDVKNAPKEQLGGPEEESESNQSLPEPTFPLVDSLSQNALRRQVLSGRLKAVYFDVLPLIGLNFKDIRDGVKKIVETFSLTPTNITFKPKEWKCIALVLVRILTQNTLKDLENSEDAHYLTLCETLLKNVSISVQEIDSLVSDLVSSNQLQRYNK